MFGRRTARTHMDVEPELPNQDLPITYCSYEGWMTSVKVGEHQEQSSLSLNPPELDVKVGELVEIFLDNALFAQVLLNSHTTYMSFRSPVFTEERGSQILRKTDNIDEWQRWQGATASNINAN